MFIPSVSPISLRSVSSVSRVEVVVAGVAAVQRYCCGSNSSATPEPTAFVLSKKI